MKAIQIENLKKCFGATQAVDSISFDVERGSVFGFLGPNGAGKTTTIRMLMDFIRPDEGKITILGKDAHRDEVELKKEIGYISGEIHLYENWTGQAHIDFINHLNGKDDTSADLVKRFDLDLAKKAKYLSSGNKQKLGLVLAFMLSPQLLILDEPTVGLDPILQNVVYDLIKERVSKGATAFLSSHNLLEVERICDHVGVIKEGSMIAEESVASLKQKKMYTVKAFFDKKMDHREFLEKDDQFIQDLPNGFELQIKSDIDTFIKKAAKHHVKDIDIVHASLEDIFLEYYEK